MTSPKAPDNNTINARLAVAFGDYERASDAFPGMVIAAGQTTTFKRATTPPAYTDSLALAVELLERACNEHQMEATLIIEPGCTRCILNSAISSGAPQFRLGFFASNESAKAVTYALDTARLSLGLIKEEQ